MYLFYCFVLKKENYRMNESKFNSSPLEFLHLTKYCQPMNLRYFIRKSMTSKYCIRQHKFLLYIQNHKIKF